MTSGGERGVVGEAVIKDSEGDIGVLAAVGGLLDEMVAVDDVGPIDSGVIVHLCAGSRTRCPDGELILKGNALEEPLVNLVHVHEGFEAAKLCEDGEEKGDGSLQSYSLWIRSAHCSGLAKPHAPSGVGVMVSDLLKA